MIADYVITWKHSFTRQIGLSTDHITAI